MELILASTSSYRKTLLARLDLPFKAVAPVDVDESRLPGESPEALVTRLSRAKAESVLAARPGALVIGSDQVAVNGEEILGKPGGFAKAREQLKKASGRRVQFLTGLCLINGTTGALREETTPFAVHFRELRDAEIEVYLNKERPYDCAGSFKWEGLGIALFARMEGEDPTALMGLPLIRLTALLAEQGMPVLKED